MGLGTTVLVGDANGVDRLVQDYLFCHGFERVIVYASNGLARNNVGQWPVNAVHVEEGVKGFAFYVRKNIQMATDADYGFMIWNGKSKGTLNNLINLTKANKKVTLFFTPLEKYMEIETFAQERALAASCGREAELLFDDLAFGRLC